MSRDHQIDEWIIRDGAKKQRQERVVPASADQLTSRDPSRGEAAMEAVAAWMSGEPSLPPVELATVSPRTVTLTFGEPATLPEPWVSEEGGAPDETWGVTHDHALTLPRGSGHGRQMTTLTGLGNVVDGSRVFASTSRWGLLNIAGTEEWTDALMLGQVMNQAAEPWSSASDIWMVGYQENAEKLVSFLSAHHPLHRLRAVDSVTEIEPADIEQSFATVYVRNARPEDYAELLALAEAPHVGVIVDRIVSEQHMFLSEGDDGIAVMGPFRTDLELYPNILNEAVSAMNSAWDAQQAYADQAAAAMDFSKLLEPVESAADGSAPEAAKADTTPPNDEPVAEDLPAPQVTPTAEVEDLASGNEQQERETVTEDAPDAEEPEASETTAMAALEETDGAQPDEPPAAPALHTPQLLLLGDFRVRTPVGELVGRQALALAILHFSDTPLPPQEISERLWPGDETVGHTARTRRSRLLSTLRDHVGDNITAGESGWSFTGTIDSDLTEVLDALGKDPETAEAEIITACGHIEIPLAGDEQWPRERDTMTGQLLAALEELKARAIDAEAFDVAKAVKSARTKLEG